ncbi:hypothetical protein QUB33_13185 [Microcoleus sp. B3-A4]|uniref:hypothetical protein n=1 Tax=Microcoleus sp. B3-A4 TaxID=2818653 RepID=UPI002FCEF6EB
MDYEQTLLFFTVLTIIEVILYKSKFFLKNFWLLTFDLCEVPEALKVPEVFTLHLGTSTLQESLRFASEARWLGRYIGLNLLFF